MERQISVYDFKKPQRYSTDNMRYLSVISEEFCKNINLFVAYELKQTNILCKLEKIEQTNYEEFINMISDDAVIIEYSIEPLVRGLIYQLDKSVALSFIDLVLGGNGVFDDCKRELTEVDRELISHIGSKFLSKMHKFEGCDSIKVSNVYTNAGSSEKYPISESVIISHMKMMNGDKEVGKMSFCNPYTCMEPVVDQLEPRRLFISKEKEYDFEFTSAIYNNINSVDIDIVARLGSTILSVEELLQVKTGDVITLDSKVNGEIDAYVGGSKSFKCKLGVIKNKKGIIITDGIEKEV